MPDRILVIASTRAQFEIYKREKGTTSHEEYIFINNSRKLRGYDLTDPTNKLVFVKPWLDNSKAGRARQQALWNVMDKDRVIPEFERT